MKRRRTTKPAESVPFPPGAPGVEGEAEPAASGETAPPPAPEKPEPFSLREDAPTPKKRLSLGLVESGGFDWDSMRPTTRALFEASLRSDPNVLRAVSPEVASSGLIQPEHIHQLLDAFSFAEQWAVPAVLKKQKGIELHPDAYAALSFTDQQKEMLGGPGAASANDLLPESFRLYWLKGSNIAAFLGIFALCIQQHIKMALAIHLSKGAMIPQPATQPQKANGAESPAGVAA